MEASVSVRRRLALGVLISGIAAFSAVLSVRAENARAAGALADQALGYGFEGAFNAAALTAAIAAIIFAAVVRPPAGPREVRPTPDASSLPPVRTEIKHAPTSGAEHPR